ncbi:MAG: radical SAM protein [Candidatus Hodarchaeales archaeon]|jgi:pyruvate-formate lyase-activating enzyme
MKCQLRVQGHEKGNCYTHTSSGKKRACDVTLRKNSEGEWERLIKSMHLSRPEDYFSIYQSGCNHDCLKCHSADFSKVFNGQWYSTSQLAAECVEFAKTVTYEEPRERATMWHAGSLCRHCGRCITSVSGERHPFCPRKLDYSQIITSVQGFGPSRNIVAFTGGDITCVADFYSEAAMKIKNATDNQLWVLVETNGYGLTDHNLDILKEGGVDAFWLDIKAFKEDSYQKLTGCSNRTVLDSVEKILELDFTLEILTLYIPEFVETDQHKQLAEFIASIDPDIPTTLLAFFPSYLLAHCRTPTFSEMVASITVMIDAGIKNLRVGNIGMFVKSDLELLLLQEMFGPRAIG